MQNKKIIFLAPTFSSGGGERVISELSLNLPDNIERTIVLFENKISYPHKGKVFFLGISLSQRLLPKIYNLFIGFLRFRKVVHQEKPDYIISFGNAPNIFNILVQTGPIVRVDNSLITCEKDFWSRIYNFLVKILFNRANKIIVVSKGLRDELISFGVRRKKINVIYNPIDIKKIKLLSEELIEPKYQDIFKHSVIINIGRLNSQKGQWHLIRAFKEAKKSKNDLKLVILGKGRLDSYFKELIKDLGLEKDVYLLGWQKNPYKFLSKSKLFVLPSLWEGLGIAILEAMACGLPVISADCKAGPREILAPNTDINKEAKDIEYQDFGILTPAFDGKKHKAADSLTKSEEFLAQAMVKVLTDKKLAVKLSQKSRQRAGDFDIKKIIKNWDFLGYEK